MSCLKVKQSKQLKNCYVKLWNRAFVSILKSNVVCLYELISVTAESIVVCLYGLISVTAELILTELSLENNLHYKE